MEPSSTDLKQTPLYATHLSLNARMAPFGGYAMPIQYEGIIREHQATREEATIFDTCHMGEFRIAGVKAAEGLEHILSCPIDTLAVGQCRYGLICNEQGGVIDDQIVYRMSADEYFMVVNASTQDDDFSWLRRHLHPSVTLINLSAQTAKIDLQGPASPRIMQQLVSESIASLRYFHWMHATWRDTTILISRTGYTGEMGFEIYVPAALAVQCWNDCREKGAVPAGLGCRDTLRLEMGLPLYGHEMDEQRNAYQSNLTRSIKTDRPFIGSDAILNPTHHKQKLVGLELEGRRACRNGDPVLQPDGTPAGTVTSGSFAPSLQKAIALAYIDSTGSATGTALLVDNGRQKLQATVVDLPFYKNATARQKMAGFL